MTRAAAPVLAVVAGLATALALVSCGGEDAKLLPGNTAQEIDENLDSVQALADEGECLAAEEAALQVSTQVEALGGIDQELKQALREGAARLNEVVATCDETTEDTVEEETVPETTETTEEDDGKKEKKEKKEKPEKDKPDTSEEPAPEEPSLPPQANGKAKGHEEEPAPAEEESGEPSGGIGPGGSAEDG